MSEAFYITAENLAAMNGDIPEELTSSEHLIYSSPAALAFNSPGAKGFGVKRAGLAVPNSVMLLVAPGCCGRNTALLSELGYSERFFYLLLDDTDIVTGRHLSKIPQAVKEIVDELDYTPSVVMICITCVDALLGTDMERVCRKCSDTANVPCAPCYMYALTREKRLPPMAAVRWSVYSLLEPQKRAADECNILGFFSPIDDKSELYPLLRSAGIKQVRELSRCKTFDEYKKLSRANFNLVLNAEARYAAQKMEKEYGIPSIELVRMYQPDKIHNQYMLFAQAIGVALDDSEYLAQAEKAVADFRGKYGKLTFAVGECLNADSFELSLALTRFGFKVSEIYGTVTQRNFVFVKKLAQLSPQTRIYSNLSPTMLYYENTEKTDAAIGSDAVYYHPDIAGIHFNEETQPFGYQGIVSLFEQLDSALTRSSQGKERLSE